MIKRGKRRNRIISIVLCMAVLLSALATYPPVRTEAANKVMTLKTARTLALRNTSTR